MKKLFLSGGGNSKQSKALDKKFIESLPNRKFLYIPVAMEGNKNYPYDKCYEWITEAFYRFKGKKPHITMLTNLLTLKIEYLKSFDAIYIGGGNTYRLLRNIKTTRSDIVLKRYLQNYGHIYGGSAGAIILGKSIETSVEENEIQYKETSGLNLVNGLSILCHYKHNTEKIKAKEFIRSHHSDVLALSEETGVIVVEGKEVQVIGSKPAYILSNKPYYNMRIKGKFVYEKIA